MGLHAVSFARGSAGARTLPLASWLTLWAAVFFVVSRAANARAAHGRQREAFNDQDRTAPLSVDVSSRSGHDNDSLQGDAAPVARYGHCAAVLDGRMYVLGGAPINGSLSGELWSFTPSLSSGSWTQVSTRGQAPPPIEGNPHWASLNPPHSPQRETYALSGAMIRATFVHFMAACDPASVDWCNLRNLVQPLSKASCICSQQPRKRPHVHSVPARVSCTLWNAPRAFVDTDHFCVVVLTCVWLHLLLTLV
jgi:hypothetical protein